MEGREGEGGLIPNQRQMNTAIHGILRNKSVYEKLPDDRPINAEERTSYLRQVVDGQIGIENYKTFLGSMKRREHQNDPDILFRDMSNEVANPEDVRKRMKKFLSHYTKGPSGSYEEVDATDVRTFLTEKGKSVIDFERMRDEYLMIIEVANRLKGREKRAQYAKATNTLGEILYGKQWEYLQQIRLLEAETKPDQVALRHVVFPAIEIPYEKAPPRPGIGTDADWRFINGEWRLTQKGIQDVPRTEHERHEQNFLFTSELTDEQQAVIANWKFDPAGRPSSSWLGTTSAGVKVGANFEQGAAQRATLRPENEIDIDTYETARDRIAKLEKGLFVFASYINLTSPERSLSALSKAAGQNITNPQVVEYLRQMLPAFGMYKPVQFAGELTNFGLPTHKEPKEGGNRVFNADDILGQWLRQEKQFPSDVREEGRRMLFTIAQNFEKSSQNDVDWTKPNGKIVLLANQAAINYRREFSGRYGFGSSWGRLRGDLLAREEDRGHQIVNPWTQN